MISTVRPVPASLASTVARAGVFPSCTRVREARVTMRYPTRLSLRGDGRQIT